MKKLFYLAIAAFTLSAACTVTPTKAQIPTKVTKIDTATNAAETYQVFTFKGVAGVISFQSTLTKLSGTAAGFVILQKSLDGVNYTNMGYDLLAKDTLTLANQTTNVQTWQYDKGRFDYYRLWFHHTGTQSVQAKGYALFR